MNFVQSPGPAGPASLVSPPMIPLGLKETNELELRTSLKQFISCHYYEDGEEYEDVVAELMDLRQVSKQFLEFVNLDINNQYYIIIYD